MWLPGPTRPATFGILNHALAERLGNVVRILRETETSMADVTDGTPNTLMVVELAKSGIHWMEPRDLDMFWSLA